jgi:hypothetical protein
MRRYRGDCPLSCFFVRLKAVVSSPRPDISSGATCAASVNDGPKAHRALRAARSVIEGGCARRHARTGRRGLFAAGPHARGQGDRPRSGRHHHADLESKNRLDYWWGVPPLILIAYRTRSYRHYNSGRAPNRGSLETLVLWVQSHYRTFNLTTGCSAPTLCIGASHALVPTCGKSSLWTHTALARTSPARPLAVGS